MAALLRERLVRLAPDPRLSPGASRARTLVESGNAYRLASAGRLFGRTMFTDGRTREFEFAVTGNRRVF